MSTCLNAPSRCQVIAYLTSSRTGVFVCLSNHNLSKAVFTFCLWAWCKQTDDDPFPFFPPPHSFLLLYWMRSHKCFILCFSTKLLPDLLIYFFFMGELNAAGTCSTFCWRCAAVCLSRQWPQVRASLLCITLKRVGMSVGSECWAHGLY